MNESILALVSSFVGGNQKERSEGSNGKSVSTYVIDEDRIQEFQNTQVVIFTKDRPWQLQQLLVSMKLRTGFDIKVEIIAKVNNSFHDSYQRVILDFEKLVNFVEESVEKPFEILLRSLIQSRSNDPNLRWMFLTDDCVMLNDLHEVLEVSKSCSVFLTRLHPGITWCQTRGIPSLPPTNSLRYQFDYFSYPLSAGVADWSYPWDMSGGIYSNAIVQKVFAKLSVEATSHPNRLELAGQSIIRKIPSLVIAFPTKITMIILALNRVQNICSAPVETCLDPKALLQYLNQGKMLDLNEYKHCRFESSHIGVIFLGNKKQYLGSDLSVIIPVHKGPPEFAILAMRSIVMQIKEQSTIRCMQIILIDDRCNDGSIEAAVISAKSAASELQESLQVNDRRESSPRMQSGSFRLTIDIYQSTKPGVASALNLGLKNSRFQYVARMDIDDISTSQRFARQIEYLQRYPELVAIGTHSMVFSSMKESESLTFRYAQVHKLPWDVEESGCWKVRPSWTPVDPALTTWALLFTCCISHPSVLYRKTDILSAGGYDEKLEHTEDYDLWLRLTDWNPTSVVSVPFVGLWHRKHVVDKERKRKQLEEADSIASMKIIHYVPGGNVYTASILRRPQSAKNQLDLDNAAELLLQLLSSFQSKHGDKISNRDMIMINFDCNERLAEIATIAVARFKCRGSRAFQIWCERCPERALEQFAIICGSNTTD